MAIDVTWPTPTNPVGIIHVPKADTTLVELGPPERRSLDVNWLRGQVGLLWASEDGAPYTKPFIHNTQVTISGIVFGRQIIFLAPYTIEFEDGQYSVRLEGANHNVDDVTVPNQVRIVTNLSAGLIRDPGSSAPTVDEIRQGVWGDTSNYAVGTKGKLLILAGYDSAFGPAVYLDGWNGSDTNKGTADSPMLTLAAARAKVTALGLPKRICLVGNFDLDVDMEEWHFCNNRQADGGRIDFNSHSAAWSQFDGVAVTGTAVLGTGYGYDLNVRDAQVDACVGVSGEFERTIHHSAMHMSADAGIVFRDAAAANTDEYTFRLHGDDSAGHPCNARFNGWRGRLQLHDFKQADSWVRVTMDGGFVEIMNSCENCHIKIEGIGTYTNAGTAIQLDVTGLQNTALGADAVATELATPLANMDVAVSTRMAAGEQVELVTGQASMLALLRKVATNRVEESSGNPGTMTLYDDDGVTPLLTFELRDEDGGAVVKSVGAPARRSAGT